MSWAVLVSAWIGLEGPVLGQQISTPPQTVEIKQFNLPAGTNLSSFRCPFDERLVFRFGFSYDGKEGWKVYKDQFGGLWGVQNRGGELYAAPADPRMAVLSIDEADGSGRVSRGHYMTEAERQTWLEQTARVPQSRTFEPVKQESRTYLEVLIDYLQDLYRRFFGG